MRLEGFQTLHPVPPSPAMDPFTAAQVSAITLQARSTQGTLAAGTNAKHKGGFTSGVWIAEDVAKGLFGESRAESRALSYPSSAAGLGCALAQ